MVWMIEANELKNSWPNKIAATIKTTITNNQSIKYIFFWCIYMNPLELILSKIPEKSQCPPPAAALCAAHEIVSKMPGSRVLVGETGLEPVTPAM